MAESEHDQLPRRPPRFKASTAVTFASAVGAGMLVYVYNGVHRGILGDESLGLWFYGTGLAFIMGVAAIPLALWDADVVPRWQWLTEGAVAVLAILAALAVNIALRPQ